MFTRLKTAIKKFNDLMLSWVNKKWDSLWTKKAGIHSLRIGLSKKIVVVYPHQMPVSTASKLLKELMPATDQDSRRVYNFITFYTGVMPFLSMPDRAGLAVRKSRVVPYLHTVLSNIDFPVEMAKLITQLKNRSDSQTNNSVIQDHIISLLVRGTLGVELPKKLQDLLFSTIDIPSSNMFVFIPEPLTPFLALISSMRKVQNACRTQIKEFMIDTLTKIKNDDSPFRAMKKNYFLDLILEKKGHPNLLSEKDIEELADDAEMKMGIALVIASKNITKVMQNAINELSDSTRRNLLVEILDQETLTPTDLLQKEKMPLLEATYLEAFRFTFATGLIRNIQKEIQCDDAHIPANSVVFFPFDMTEQMGSDQYPANQFAPERFLNEKNQLRDDIKLNQGTFTPFGIGARMCPAQRLTEQLIKIYLVSLLNSVAFFNKNRHIFYDEKEITPAKNAIAFSLKYSLRVALFAPLKVAKEKPAAKEIIKHIVGYCL